MPRKRKIKKAEAEKEWNEIKSILRKVNADLVATGWHEDGYYYVEVATANEDMENCVTALKAFGYKGSTGRKKAFNVVKGDLGEMRKASHSRTKGYKKADGKLEG